MKTAARVFIIIGMVVQCYLIFPVIIGIIALVMLSKAKRKSQLTVIAIITLIGCNTIGGILMLALKDSDFVDDQAQQNGQYNPYQPYGQYYDPNQPYGQYDPNQQYDQYNQNQAYGKYSADQSYGQYYQNPQFTPNQQYTTQDFDNTANENTKQEDNNSVN